MIILLFLFMVLPCLASEPPKTTFQKAMEEKGEYKCPVCKRVINIQDQQRLFYYDQEWYHVRCWYNKQNAILLRIPLYEANQK